MKRSVATVAWTLGVLACDDRAPTATNDDLASAISLTTVSGDSQVGETGRLLGEFLVFRITDAGARPISGLRVEWEVVSGNGKVSGKRHETDAAGLAAGNFTLGPEPGEHVARAVVLDSLSVAFTAFAVPPVPEVPAEARADLP